MSRQLDGVKGQILMLEFAINNPLLNIKTPLDKLGLDGFTFYTPLLAELTRVDLIAASAVLCTPCAP